MQTPLTTRVLIIAAGILLLAIAGINYWNTGDFQPYDNITTTSSDCCTDVTLTEKGNCVAGMYVRPGPGYGLGVPVSVMVSTNHSWYRFDSAELCITREEMGDIYFGGYQKEFPKAVSWIGNDGQSGCTYLETPGWWGDSTQTFNFMIPLRKDTEMVHLVLDARIREKGPFWRQNRVRLPVTVNLTGYPAPVAGTVEQDHETPHAIPQLVVVPVKTTGA